MSRILRVYELQQGMLFVYNNLIYRVTEINDNEIIFDNHYERRILDIKNRKHISGKFGRQSQQKIEIYE